MLENFTNFGKEKIKGLKWFLARPILIHKVSRGKAW